MALVRLPSIRLWWAHVTVTPDARRTAVFRSGTLNGLIGVTPIGGQQQPNSGVGASLLWKKAQKNAKKKHTSDKMNRIIPHRSPLATYDVWCPRNVASRATSRHHWIIDRAVTSNATRRQDIPYPWNQLARPTASRNAPRAEVNGHGLNSTKWNGCRGMYVFY